MAARAQLDALAEPRRPSMRTSEPSSTGATNVAVVPNGSSTSAANVAVVVDPPVDRHAAVRTSTDARAHAIPSSGFGADHDVPVARSVDVRSEPGHVPVDPVDDRAVGVVVERQHVSARRPPDSGISGGVVIVPGWMEPSGRIASQRSQTVVAPWSTW